MCEMEEKNSPTKTCGSDGIHPSQGADIPDDLLWTLQAIFSVCITIADLPSTMATIFMSLIPKPSNAGDRTVGIFNGLLRLFLRALRRTVGNRWLTSTVPGNWYGVRGRSVIQAAWSRLTMARYLSDTKGMDTSAILFDVTKAFDHLQWNDLRAAADTLAFPMDLFEFLISLYSCPRFMLVTSVSIR